MKLNDLFATIKQNQQMYSYTGNTAYEAKAFDFYAEYKARGGKRVIEALEIAPAEMVTEIKPEEIMIQVFKVRNDATIESARMYTAKIFAKARKHESVQDRIDTLVADVADLMDAFKDLTEEEARKIKVDDLVEAYEDAIRAEWAVIEAEEEAQKIALENEKLNLIKAEDHSFKVEQINIEIKRLTSRFADYNAELDMAYHNLYCYSANVAMTVPDPKYTNEWRETKEEIENLKDKIQLFKRFIDEEVAKLEALQKMTIIYPEVAEEAPEIQEETQQFPDVTVKFSIENDAQWDFMQTELNALERDGHLSADSWTKTDDAVYVTFESNSAEAPQESAPMHYRKEFIKSYELAIHFMAIDDKLFDLEEYELAI